MGTKSVTGYRWMFQQGTSRNSLYYCQASNKQTTVNSTYSYPEIAVSSVSLTTITSANQEVGSAEGQPLTLTCVTSASYPAATVTWYKNSVEVTVGISSSNTVTSGVAVQATSAVTFTSVVRSDLGHTVYCRATNIHTPSLVQSDNGPEQVGFTQSDNAVAFEKRNLTLTCTTTAYPNLTFTWDYSDGTPVGGSTGPVAGSSTRWSQTLTFRPNKDKTAVRYPPPVPPSITKFQTLMFEGDQETIICSVTGGNPLATITWSCPGTGSASVSDSGQTRTSTLSFTVSRSQNGQQCQCLGAWQYGGYNQSDVRTFSVSCPTNPQPLNAEYNMAGVIAGSTIGTLLLTLLIGGLVLIVLYRKGFRFGNVLKVELKAETSTYEDMTEAPPVSYESIGASPYQNSGAQPQAVNPGIGERIQGGTALPQSDSIRVRRYRDTQPAGSDTKMQLHCDIRGCCYFIRMEEAGGQLSAVNIVSGSVTPQRAVFWDSWGNKGVFVGDYTSSLDIQLHASHVTSSYAGTYSCQVSGLSGSGRVDVTASVLGVPSISGLPSIYRVIESSRLNVDCSTYTTPGNPPTTSYTWTYGSTVSAGAVLDRSRISRSQGGNYTCTASNTQGSDSASVNVDVQYVPSISGLPPVQTVTEFSNLRIDCSTYTTPGNHPTTSYTWTYGGSTVSTVAVLDRSRISRSQGGSYTSTASNSLTPSGGSQQQGTATAQVNVDVQYQASISMFTANSLSGILTVNESDPVTLRCQIDSNPRSIIRLLNGTEELTRADNSMTAEYRLESADCRQRGNYSCTATNS
ncbi:hemicentin-2-like, partial [Haliotis rufescens]|uniref:hemicentin-2-like n=1 Tax=Haliotis rufescens TaxID=6454 RepID=UPI00201F5D35